MIFRRVANQVRAQDWTAVAIELVILVLGVFIGIQASNWNDARRETLSAAQYLMGLEKDLRADIDSLDDVLAADRARISAVNYVLGHARGEAPGLEIQLPYGDKFFAGASFKVDNANQEPSAAAKQALWSIVNFTRSVQPNRSSYDTLVSTGNLDLIIEKSVADALISYQRGIAGLESMENGTLRPLRLHWVEVGNRLGLSALESVPEARMFELARSDDEFAAVLRTARDASIGHYVAADLARRRAREVLQLIEQSKP